MRESCKNWFTVHEDLTEAISALASRLVDEYHALKAILYKVILYLKHKEGIPDMSEEQPTTPAPADVPAPEKPVEVKAVEGTDLVTVVTPPAAPDPAALENSVDALLARATAKAVGTIEEVTRTIADANAAAVKAAQKESKDYLKAKLKKYTGAVSDLQKAVKATGSTMETVVQGAVALTDGSLAGVVAALPELQKANEERKATTEAAKQAKAGDEVKTTVRAWNWQQTRGMIIGMVIVTFLVVALKGMGVI